MGRGGSGRERPVRPHPIFVYSAGLDPVHPALGPPVRVATTLAGAVYGKE